MKRAHISIVGSDFIFGKETVVSFSADVQMAFINIKIYPYFLLD